MKAFDQGCFYRVTVSADEAENFGQSWPCCGFRYGERFSFTFDKRNGDLVDLACFKPWGQETQGEHVDQGALLALSQDAQAYGKLKLSLP